MLASLTPASRSLPCPHSGVFTGRVKTGSLIALSDLPPGLWRSPARLRVLSDIFPFVREHLSTYGKSTYVIPNDADFYYMVIYDRIKLHHQTDFNFTTSSGSEI